MTVYWPGLGKVDLTGKGKGRASEDGVSFVAGANTNWFNC